MTHDPDSVVDMDGRTLRPVAAVDGGEVGADTRFEFEQDGEIVHARYSGGSIRLGFLVGTNRGDELHFRYTQVNQDGETATGQSTDQIELLDDGRVRLHETWSWDSKTGEGTSELEEIPPDESLTEQ